MSLQAATPPLILASSSSARKDLLGRAGVAFEAIPAHIDEAGIKAGAKAEGASAEETALLLADLKAERVARRRPEGLIIGGDQLLVCEGRWFDKPRDAGEAREHLTFLRNRTHTLVTSVVCWRNGARVWHHVANPRLAMRDFSDDFLGAYLAAEGEALTTTVGAYRVEGIGLHLFDRIDGDDASIQGLPLLPLLGFLRQHRVLLA